MNNLNFPTITGKKAALVDSSNVVVNVIVWADDENHAAPIGLTPIMLDASHNVSIGWVYNAETKEFTDPTPPAEIHISGMPSIHDMQSQIVELQQQIQQLLSKQ
jgi:hypothetical protein